MASSSCRCLLLTRCVRNLGGFNRKSYYSVSNPYINNLSRNLFLKREIISRTTSGWKGLWDSRRWLTNVGPSSSTSSSNVNQEQSDPKQEANTSSSKEHEKKKAANLQWKATKYTLIGLALMFSCTAGWILVVWGSPQNDEEGKQIKDEFSDMPVIKAYIKRAWRELLFYDQMIKEPSREKLLPDPAKEPFYQPPYTLVMEMTDVLVHPDWTYKTGWRFKKRPGVDFFLQQVGSMFEIVIYTSEQGLTAFPILDSLDPNGFIMYKLFRDATRYKNGVHIKDLSCLNRDLSKVIMVDWNDKAVEMQPENALRIKKWSGNDDDTMVNNDVEDVRTVLQFYKQFDDPIFAFKENQRRLQEEEERLNRQKATASERPTLVQSWSSGLLGRRR